MSGPLAGGSNARNTHHFIASGQAAFPRGQSLHEARPAPGYAFSPNAYMEAGLIWNGKHPEDNSELVVIQGAKKGVPYPVLEEEP